MKLIKYNEFSINESYKIGDGFDPRYYIVWKNDTKPRALQTSKGYHPNAIDVVSTLYITSEDDNYWIFNDGEYKAKKNVWQGIKL